MAHQLQLRRTRRTIRAAAALLLGTAIGAVAITPAAAQQSTASIRGTITAGEGGQATQVIAVDQNSGIRRTSSVGADGSYNFASLRPGQYRLEIVLPTGSRQTDVITLTVGQAAQLDFDFSAAATPAPATSDADLDAAAEAASEASVTDVAAEGEIIVTANRLVTLDGGEVGTTISQRLIEQLPQNNRNFLAFADLAPGVAFVTASNGNSRIQGGAQRSNSVNVFIDGVSQKDYVLQNGITGQDSTQGNPFPQLAVGEYKVISSNYKAEFDQVSSVAITAVTKSGTNEFHGEGFIDFTNQDFRALRPSEFQPGASKIETQDMQFGGALGGPIIRDLAHFFVTYEGKRQQVPVDIFPGDNRTVASIPAEYQGIFGSTNRSFNEDLYFGKIDLVPTDNDLFEVSVKYRKETGENLNNGIAAASTRSLVDTEELRGTFRWEHTGETWVNDLKVSYQDVKWNPTPAEFGNASLFQTTRSNINDEGNLVITRADLFRIGGSSNFQDKGQKGTTVQDDFTYTGFDGHTIKLGAKASWIQLNSVEQNNFNPLYTYNSDLFGDGTFNDTIPYRVQFGALGPSGSPVVRSDNFQFGVYVQDDWDVTERLTLNLGIRWDYERTPAFLNYAHPADALAAVSPENYPNLVNADYDINDYISTGNEREVFLGAFQPRIGFSYELDADARFIVFGGYGRSYDRNQFDFLQQETSTGAFPTRTFNFITDDPLNECDPGATCLPFDPIYLTQEGRDQLAANASGGGRELRFINNDLKVPYSDQFSLGLKTRFDPVDLEVGYTHIESRDGFVYLLGNRRPDGNFFEPGAAPNSPFGFAPPGFGSIIIGDNGLETSSDAAYVKLVKRYTVASPWSIDATYTYTQAEENRAFGETFSLDFPSIEDYPVLRSSGVPRHRFVAAGSVDLPIDLSLSAKFTLESPPFLKGFINQGFAPFERILVGTEAEGNGDRWGRRQMDLAVTKYIPLGFISDETQIRFRVDIINLFNDRNYINYNGNPADDSRDDGSPTIFGEQNGFDTGGNPPRTIKVSAGFSF
ncbi:TonB-dependent receptor [Sphingomonas japonica]|uniref:Outer membrane receptor protein involved in Fe transport n=1 Tax=Sphingomonas japonica TaxID=511662 RepID=A0ABX0TWP8_9SPHN|nr:TonB-dependent receptor [Sphingomonas japonica]NIJ22733.1 outer membrane receptor protein involved in Fe transport [Sphingomonas japonica]